MDDTRRDFNELIRLMCRDGWTAKEVNKLIELYHSFFNVLRIVVAPNQMEPDLKWSLDGRQPSRPKLYMSKADYEDFDKRTSIVAKMMFKWLQILQEHGRETGKITTKLVI